MQALLFLLYGLLFTYIVYKWDYCRDDTLKGFVLPALFVIKLLFGYCFYLVYTYYYADHSTADMYKYFDDSAPLYDCLLHAPATFIRIVFMHDTTSSKALFYLQQMNHWQLGYDRQFENSHQMIILFNVLCRFFSFGYILPHFVFINFLSFIGLVGIWKSFGLFFTSRKSLFLWPVFLVPSVLFWGSGLLKEGLLFFALGVALYAFFRSLVSPPKKVYHFMLSLLFLVFVFKIKSYVGIAILPIYAVGIFCYFFSFKRVVMVFIAATVFAFVIGFNIQEIVPSINPTKAINEKIFGFKEVMHAAHPSSGYDIGANEHMSTGDIITLMPKAIYLCLCRPYLWEANNPFSFLVVGENLLFWLLLMVAIFTAIYYRKSDLLNHQQVYLLLGSISSIFILYFIIGITSFNFGALVRYKTPGLVFLFSIPFMLISSNIVEKIKKTKIFTLFLR